MWGLQGQSLWAPKGVAWKQWQLEHGGMFWVGGMEDIGEWLPSRACIDPLPPILLLLIQFYAVPPPPRAALPPLTNWHILTNPDPEKEKNWVCHKGQT